MFYELKNKYKFVYSENDSESCCVSANDNQIVVCESCLKNVCLECTFKIEGVYLHRECSGYLRKDTKLLESFQRHNMQAKETLGVEGFEFDVSQISNRDKASCAVNIEAEKILASLIMWDSGECELSVMNKIIDPLDIIFYIYRVLNDEIELQSYLADAYGVLREIQCAS